MAMNSSLVDGSFLSRTDSKMGKTVVAWEAENNCGIKYEYMAPGSSFSLYCNALATPMGRGHSAVVQQSTLSIRRANCAMLDK